MLRISASLTHKDVPPMPSVYLTPASISYQFLLTLVIMMYLSWRLLRPKQQPTSGTDRLLAFFFVMVTLLSLGLFLERKTSPPAKPPKNNWRGWRSPNP